MACEQEEAALVIAAATEVVEQAEALLATVARMNAEAAYQACLMQQSSTAGAIPTDVYESSQDKIRRASSFPTGMCDQLVTVAKQLAKANAKIVEA